MDSAALLDLLGNENRRRILQLLSKKPCYVTEISEYLGVSPKAVIDHLGKLEAAGIVESHTDDRQRKYFHINRNLRLEVNVSPYSFGAKSAYPASRSLDITTCRYLSVDIDIEETTDRPEQLATELDRLEQLENELSMTQRWVQGRITELLEQLTDELDDGFEFDGRLYTDVLVSVVQEPKAVSEIADSIDAPPSIVEEALLTMADHGYVERTGRGWVVAEDA